MRWMTIWPMGCCGMAHSPQKFGDKDCRYKNASGDASATANVGIRICLRDINIGKGLSQARAQPLSLPSSAELVLRLNLGRTITSRLWKKN